MQNEQHKQVNLSLVGVDGNAFSIMGAFKEQARKEHWSPKEIEEVLKEAMSQDYDHLLYTIVKHCKDGEDDYVDREVLDEEIGELFDDYIEYEEDFPTREGFLDFVREGSEILDNVSGEELMKDFDKMFSDYNEEEDEEL